jgi:hypothetical protein
LHKYHSQQNFAKEDLWIIWILHTCELKDQRSGNMYRSEFFLVNFNIMLLRQGMQRLWNSKKNWIELCEGNYFIKFDLGDCRLQQIFRDIFGYITKLKRAKVASIHSLIHHPFLSISFFWHVDGSLEHFLVLLKLLEKKLYLNILLQG